MSIEGEKTPSLPFFSSLLLLHLRLQQHAHLLPALVPGSKSAPLSSCHERQFHPILRPRIEFSVKVEILVLLFYFFVFIRDPPIPSPCRRRRYPRQQLQIYLFFSSMRSPLPKPSYDLQTYYFSFSFFFLRENYIYTT